jgi:hypothetical protein
MVSHAELILILEGGGAALGGILIGAALGYILGERAQRKENAITAKARMLRAAAVYYQDLNLYAGAIRTLPRTPQEVTDPTAQLDSGRFPEVVARDVLARGVADLPAALRDRTTSVYAELDVFSNALRRVQERVGDISGPYRESSLWSGRGPNDNEFVHRYEDLTQARARALELAEPLLKDLTAILHPD